MERKQKEVSLVGSAENKAHLPESLVLETVSETVKNFATVWKSHPYVDQVFAQTIDNHLNSIPIWKELF